MESERVSPFLLYDDKKILSILTNFKVKFLWKVLIIFQ